MGRLALLLAFVVALLLGVHAAHIPHALGSSQHPVPTIHQTAGGEPGEHSAHGAHQGGTSIPGGAERGWSDAGMALSVPWTALHDAWCVVQAVSTSARGAVSLVFVALGVPLLLLAVAVLGVPLPGFPPPAYTTRRRHALLQVYLR